MPDAVGFRYGRGYVIPRKKNFFRLKRSVKKYFKRKEAGLPIPEEMARSILSRLGMISHCNNYNLYHILFGDKKDEVIKDLKNIVRITDKNSQLRWDAYIDDRRNKMTINLTKKDGDNNEF